MALAQIRARIGVIRLAMERYRDTDRWYSFSHVQSTALISSLRSLNSDADAVALADLCQEAGLLQWAGQDGERLLEAFSEAMSMQDTAVRRRGRRHLQNYKSFLEYFEEQEWNQLFDSTCNAQSKLALLLQKMLSLGGRTLDEHSSKLGSSAYLLVTETPEKLRAMPAGYKKAIHNQFKRDFKTMAFKTGIALTHITELPPNPSTLLQEHPAIYKQAFGDGSPVPCKLALDQLVLIEASYGCRGGGSATQKRSRSSFDAPTMHAGGLGSGVVCSMDANGAGLGTDGRAGGVGGMLGACLGTDGRAGGVGGMLGMFAMAMMKQMQQLNERQENFERMMQGGGQLANSNGSAPNAPKALKSLLGNLGGTTVTPRRNVRRARTLDSDELDGEVVVADRDRGVDIATSGDEDSAAIPETVITDVHPSPTWANVNIKIDPETGASLFQIAQLNGLAKRDRKRKPENADPTDIAAEGTVGVDATAIAAEGTVASKNFPAIEGMSQVKHKEQSERCNGGFLFKPPGATEYVKPPSYAVERSRSQVTCRTGWKGVGQSHQI